MIIYAVSSQAADPARPDFYKSLHVALRRFIGVYPLAALSACLAVRRGHGLVERDTWHSKAVIPLKLLVELKTAAYSPET